MARKRIETIIRQKIAPYTLNSIGKSKLAELTRRYSYDLLVECIDISASKYLRCEKDGKLDPNSINIFINKIGGIAHNKSLTPVDQEICHLINKGKQMFAYFDDAVADDLLHVYVGELRKWWSEEEILDDLKGESKRLMNNSKNWSDWRSVLEQWIKDIKNWAKEDLTVEQAGTILPDALFSGLHNNIQLICKQINASYEKNLFDCTAVMMRRLLESLLVLAYQKAGIENEISNGNNHVPLDKIIKNAEQNSTLMLSSNTKKDMALFKDLGNYSAHKIWYNCTQGDIKPHILKYRVIIEELMYKAGVK